LSINERLPINKLSPGIDQVQIKLVVHLPTTFAICLVYSWFSRENNLLHVRSLCVRQLGHNLPNAMHRRQKHTNSWEKGHFDAFNHVVKALEYRVTCFLEDSVFFYTNSTRAKLHGSDVNKLRDTGNHCHIWRFYRKFRQKIWNQECAVMLTRVDETIARSFVFLENSHDFAKLILHR